MRRGQAMLETALAVLFITILFLGLFQLSQMLEAKVLLDHAAARAARAKAVGFNDWMCLKSARVAMIPVAGRMLWPEEEDRGSITNESGEVIATFNEVSRVPDYLSAEDEPLARGILEYERWRTMEFFVRSGQGVTPEAEAAVSIEIPRFYVRTSESDFDEDGGYAGETVTIEGSARVESHFPYYMYDQGR